MFVGSSSYDAPAEKHYTLTFFTLLYSAQIAVAKNATAQIKLFVDLPTRSP